MMANFYLKVDLIPDKLSFKTTYNHAYTSLDERNVGFPFYVDDQIRKRYRGCFNL